MWASYRAEWAKVEASSNLVSLGSIFYSPLWVFYRGDEPLDDLSQLRGKRISIGPEGSGVRKFSLDLLKAGGASDPPTEMFEYPIAEAARAIQDGRVEAVMTFGSADSPAVLELFAAPGIQLMNFSQAEAYTRLFPNLSHVILPKGVLNPARRFPAADIHLLAPTTNLIARSNLHPALTYLLLEAAVEIHGGAGWVHSAGEFPALKTQDFPVSDQAQRYYKSGGSLLYDYLPFWAFPHHPAPHASRWLIPPWSAIRVAVSPRRRGLPGASGPGIRGRGSTRGLRPRNSSSRC